MTGDKCVVLELVPLMGEKISSHTQKIGSWYLLGVLFKIPNKHPFPFYMGICPPPPCPWNQIGFGELLFQYTAQEKTIYSKLIVYNFFPFEFGRQFQFNSHESNPENGNKIQCNCSSSS